MQPNRAKLRNDPTPVDNTVKGSGSKTLPLKIPDISTDKPQGVGDRVTI